MSEQDHYSYSVSIPESCISDEESVLSYKCSSTSEGQGRTQLQDRRDYSADESEQPLLSAEISAKSSFKHSSRQSQGSCSVSIPENCFSDHDEESVLSFNNNCSSVSEIGRWTQLYDRNWSADGESEQPLLSETSVISIFKQASKQSQASCSVSIPESCFSDVESVSSYNNNCSSKSEGRWTQPQDRNWSADESEQPLLPKKAVKSSIKSSSKKSEKASKVKFSPAAKIKKKSKKTATGAIGYLWRVLRSEPSEHETVKMLLGFPIGLVIAGSLFFTVIQPLDLDPDSRNLAGSVMSVLLAVGYAFSIQIRCVVLLVLPIFFGKAGRTFIGAFALIFLLSGPIDNIVTNFREVARSLSCLASLLANHTVAKWKLRLNPLKEAVEELQEEGFMISRVSQVVRKAFGPLIRELEDKNEVDEMEEDLEEVQKIIKKNKEHGPPPNAFSVAEVKDKHGLKSKLSQAQAIQEQWEKKLDLRCEDVFGKAVVKCREWFGDLWDKCLDALWILGYVLCLPLKLTFFCELVKIMPGALGMSCDSMDVVEPGLGETYQAAKEMIAEVADGLKVQLQYRLTSREDTGPSLMTAEEIRAGTMHEFESKSRWASLILLVVKRLIMCTFLMVFREAYQYHQAFLTLFQHDNVYITKYFRRIDARRHAQGKKCLLPLKKTEKSVVIFPTSIKMMPREKKQAKFSVLGVLFKTIMTALIVYVDYLLVWIMDVIYRNSRIEYHQTGEHFVNVTVHGKGFMAEIVRMFLTSLNSHHKLDSITTNHVCLPLAREPNKFRTAMVFVVHFFVLVFIFLEAYGLRLRRLICSFFYRKREKRRVLYMYNEMLKKRKGFLRHMRHRVRKQVRNRKLKGQTNVLTALTLQFPRLCCCLKWLKASKESCLICQEPEGKTFTRCPTPGCNWGYCAECWKDIKYKCYACGGKVDGESGTDPEDESDDDSDSDSVDPDDDERFLH